jgi:hypothetical protein
MTSVRDMVSTVHRCERKGTFGQNGLSLLLSSDYLSRSVEKWPKLARGTDLWDRLLWTLGHFWAIFRTPKY